jgi:hypothetical protein
MAVANYFDSIVDFGPERPVAQLTFAETFDHDALMDLEFSEIGRDSRFLPGWYILPSIVGGLLVLVSLAVR